MEVRRPNRRAIRWAFVPAFLLLLVAMLPTPAWAYLGPSAGVSAIGALLAILAGIVVAIFGFIWYPVRRLLRRGRKADDAEETPPE